MLQLFDIFKTIFNDAPENWQIGFQDSATPGFTGITDLHDTIFFYLIIICVGVFWVLMNVIYVFNSSKSSLVHKYLNHGTLLETIWTIMPALVLIAIAFPSFRLLYLMDFSLFYNIADVKLNFIGTFFLLNSVGTYQESKENIESKTKKIHKQKKKISDKSITKIKTNSTSIIPFGRRRIFSSVFKLRYNWYST